MLPAVLADAVLALHFAFILFVIFGALLAWRWPRLIWLHLPALFWGGGIELAGGICPLTPLENELRALAGEAGYRGGFIEHYLLPLIYPAALTRGVQIGLGLGVLVFNAVLYAALWRAGRFHGRRS